MITRRKILLGAFGWVAGITGVHFATNVDWSVALNNRLPLDKRKLNVAYIPVT